MREIHWWLLVFAGLLLALWATGCRLQPQPQRDDEADCSKRIDQMADAEIAICYGEDY